jgi:hypothetical protein
VHVYVHVHVLLQWVLGRRRGETRRWHRVFGVLTRSMKEVRGTRELSREFCGLARVFGQGLEQLVKLLMQRIFVFRNKVF